MKRKCFSSIFVSWEHDGYFSCRRMRHEKWFRRVPRDPLRTPKTPVFGLPKSRPPPPAKSAQKVHFRGEKWAFLTDLCTKLHIFDTFFADIAPGLWAASPSGKNPPIYTVLNAAFSAPGPPRLWHRGGTPVPDALTRAPVRPF